MLERGVIVVAVLAVWPGLSSAQGGGAAARPPASGPARVKVPAARDAEGQERARKLAQHSQDIAKLLADSDPAAGLEQLSAAGASAWTAPYVQRMKDCVPLWAEMASAAQAGRPADLARAALKGHLVVDAISADVHTANVALQTRFLTIVSAEVRDMEAMGQVRDDMRIGTTAMQYLATTLDTFDLAIGGVAENAPSDVQSALFEAIAARLHEAKPTRPRLEALMRTLHDRQRDPAARKAAAARMAALSVPLTLPSPSPAPSQGSN